jgi:catechol 2,3-dioxygenase-like lactoylglutathione lyase family enzyme
VAGIVAVGHVGLHARDFAKLVAFYRDGVGLSLAVHRDGVVAIFEVGDVDLFILPGEPAELGFDLAADDVDAFRGRLVNTGIECSPTRDDRTSGHRSFTFADPEANVVHVTNAHPRTRRARADGERQSR